MTRSTTSRHARLTAASPGSPIRRHRAVFASALGVALVVVSGGVAHSQAQQASVVLENPADYTPVLVPTSTVDRPRVDAIAQLGSTMYAGGVFTQVKEAGGATFNRKNMMAFDAATGAISQSFATPVSGNVLAVEAGNGSLYVGGTFGNIGGVVRGGVAKINPVTGAVDTAFNARLSGRVNDLLLLGSGADAKLLVAGEIPGQLIALNPNTGANTGYINLSIADPIPGASEPLSVHRIAIDPASQKLVATGNFRTVSGQARSRVFVADLNVGGASLNAWYYPGFAKSCSSTQSNRIAYIWGVDFSPDGQFFSVAATGQIPATKADIWPTGSSTYHTVCDGAGRFSMANDKKPVWVNYTGGDTIWDVVDTGAAVYVQGHFQWLDNPQGWASRCPDGQVCASRKGIGAIDPVTGKALPWNPRKAAQRGGKDMLATSTGLWVASDSARFNGEPRLGIAFAPLP